ncbi:MAG: peptide deformylase [Verrucomicrobia bacterium]|nr:MAG: peptide deformylase [Verrucomicrobiota bacterium]TAE87472.1 MAG: peptide deformylase [Verrucomicrobiota bacterium]TAF25755.1 MAG: peptide deformylase [Verrucomicrobiota bacterium]TAF41542.1 MAG: peptide deformylase [Verrucomicrobiota bacterium]
MILEIVQYGHPVLRERCKPVGVVDDSLRQLVGDMLETMNDANGVGLAAPQVGVALRLAVVDVSHDPECISFLKVGGQDAPLASIMPLVFINPELEFVGPKERDTEGCLSIRDLRADVSRPSVIKARLPQLDGTVLEIETDGLLARAIQHETDHLNGVLYIDRVSPAAKISLRRQLRRLAAEQ